MRGADRLWRFDHAASQWAASWFGMDPANYTDRLATKIVPDMITQAACEMGTAVSGPVPWPCSRQRHQVS
jgi:hypothetical protein